MTSKNSYFAERTALVTYVLIDEAEQRSTI